MKQIRWGANEWPSRISVVFAIYVPKIIKVGASFTYLWFEKVGLFRGHSVVMRRLLHCLFGRYRLSFVLFQRRRVCATAQSAHTDEYYKRCVFTLSLLRNCKSLCAVTSAIPFFCCIAHVGLVMCWHKVQLLNASNGLLCHSSEHRILRYVISSESRRYL